MIVGAVENVDNIYLSPLNIGCSLVNCVYVGEIPGIQLSLRNTSMLLFKQNLVIFLISVEFSGSSYISKVLICVLYNVAQACLADLITLTPACF